MAYIPKRGEDVRIVATGGSGRVMCIPYVDRRSREFAAIIRVEDGSLREMHEREIEPQSAAPRDGEGTPQGTPQGTPSPTTYVVVEVQGGTVEEVHAPAGVRSLIVDWDSLEEGARARGNPTDQEVEQEMMYVEGLIGEGRFKDLAGYLEGPPDDGYDEDPRVVGYPN